MYPAELRRSVQSEARRSMVRVRRGETGAVPA